LARSARRTPVCRHGYPSFIPDDSYTPGVETFTDEKPLTSSPSYDSERRKALEDLENEISNGSIDAPTMDIVEQFTRMPYCYTLQSCWGHFMVKHCVDDRNIRRVAEIGPKGDSLHYRIAYIALCIQNSSEGRALLADMKATPQVDPEFIQFGCADWFWETCVNSYVLQVSPLRNAHEDHFDVSIDEALRIEQARDRFYERLRGNLSIKRG